MKNYYKPSGKFSPLSFIYFILISVIALPILGLIYAYCIWYIPFPYITFLIAAGFGLLIVLLINTLVVGKGKVRNPLLAMVFGLLAGLIGLYFHWAIWVDLVLNAGESYGNSRIGVTVSNIKILDVFALALNPGKLFELIGEINKYGTWGFKGSTPTGVFLYLIWGVELLIVVGISSYLPNFRARQPFCEKGNEWFKEKELQGFSYIEDTLKMKKGLEKGDDSAFEDITSVESLEQDHSIFTLYSSKHNENYLTIQNKKAKTDSKGKISFTNDMFVEYIRLDNTLKETILKV